MDDWQPIETAPKDGTRVLACWPEKRLENPFFYIAVGHYREHRKSWYVVNSPQKKPTHWMPLPVPPKTSQINRGDVPQLEEV